LNFITAPLPTEIEFHHDENQFFPPDPRDIFFLKKTISANFFQRHRPRPLSASLAKGIACRRSQRFIQRHELDAGEHSDDDY
jgi:hypothetical protein